MPTSQPPAHTKTIRRRDLLLSLYRHPLKMEHLLRLNSTFTHPFPTQQATWKDRTYPVSRVLQQYLKEPIADGQVRQPEPKAEAAG